MVECSLSMREVPGSLGCSQCFNFSIRASLRQNTNCPENLARADQCPDRPIGSQFRYADETYQVGQQWSKIISSKLHTPLLHQVHITLPYLLSAWIQMLKKSPYLLLLAYLFRYKLLERSKLDIINIKKSYVSRLCL